MKQIITDQKQDNFPAIFRSQFVISPFVSFHPYFGQDPRSIETWNNTTIRVGAAFKFGSGKGISKEMDQGTLLMPKVIEVPNIHFKVNSPKNIATEHRVREIFPLRNYVFFDLGSNEIPDRYVLLTKSQVKNFKEDLSLVPFENGTPEERFYNRTVIIDIIKENK